MPIKTPNMNLPIPTHDDIDRYIEGMKAKWIETRDRAELARAVRSLRLMVSLAADKAKDS